MTFEVDLLHPHLRNKDDNWLTLRSSVWCRWFFPAEEQVNWYGDIRLYCRPADYQHVLDTVPGAVTVGEGLSRQIIPMWNGLDDYRLKIEKWLKRTRFSGG